MDSEDICSSASIIYKNFINIAVDPIQVKTFFTDISGCNIFLKILAMYPDNRVICENLMEVLEGFITKIDRADFKKDTAPDWKKGLEVINNLMTKHRTSRKITRTCLSISKVIAEDPSKITKSIAVVISMLIHFSFQ